MADRATLLVFVFIGLLPCPFRKFYPDVLMMQSSQDRNGDNDTGPLDCSMQGRVFLQCQVRALAKCSPTAVTRAIERLRKDRYIHKTKAKAFHITGTGELYLTDELARLGHWTGPKARRHD